MDRIREAVESLPDSSIDLSAGPDQLRGAVQELAAQVQDIDQQGIFSFTVVVYKLN